MGALETAASRPLRLPGSGPSRTLGEATGGYEGTAGRERAPSTARERVHDLAGELRRLSAELGAAAAALEEHGEEADSLLLRQHWNTLGQLGARLARATAQARRLWRTRTQRETSA